MLLLVATIARLLVPAMLAVACTSGTITGSESGGSEETPPALGADAAVTAVDAAKATPPPPPEEPDAAATPVDNDGSLGQLCVDIINNHRASIGLPPYNRWTASESCAANQAKSDSETGQAHGAFGACGEFAQNECPGWPGPPDQMLHGCLQLMWDEGPGQGPEHGHYRNMSSQQYKKVACGVYQTPSGSYWSIQDFR